MLNGKRSLLVGSLGAALISAAFGAQAQEAGNTNNGTIIGPPQLKDFSLEPRERLVTQPTPQPQPPATTPAPSAEASPAETRQPQPRAAQPERLTPAPATGAPPQAAPRAEGMPITAPPPSAPLESNPAPVAAAPQADVSAPAAAAEPETGGSYRLYAVAAAALALLLGLVLVLRRRRAAAAEPAPEPVTLAAAPPRPAKPRHDPVPRPWLELTLKAERCSFTATEAEVLFELEIANNGGSAARNLRIDVKMFNAGAEQDKEIGAFFKTAGRESTKLNLPEVEAGVVGVIQGSVRMPLEEMRAMKLEERLLFIPVVAVNGLYDWGEGRTGQTSRSYVIGRELQEQKDKMGAFRVDQGPRIWRTVAQRPHKLAKRV